MPSAGYRAQVRIKDAFELGEVEVARSIIRAHPFATLVTADLHATHMPCLVDEDAAGLAILGHVARADPAAESLGGPLLAIFHGPHGYVTASWYATETIPTWNHVTLHIRGEPELLDDAMPVLSSHRTSPKTSRRGCWPDSSDRDRTRTRHSPRPCARSGDDARKSLHRPLIGVKQPVARLPWPPSGRSRGQADKPADRVEERHGVNSDQRRPDSGDGSRARP